MFQILETQNSSEMQQIFQNGGQRLQKAIPKTARCSISRSKTFVPAQKPNLLNGNHLLVWHKIFGTTKKCI